MGNSIITSREFNQDVSKAKRDARKGPVFITDRGQPSHVLLSIETYQLISDTGTSITDLLAMPGSKDVTFKPVRSKRPLYRPADLSD